MNKKLYMLPMCLMLFSVASCGDNTSSIDGNTTDTSIIGDSVSDTPQISDDSSTSIVVSDDLIDIAAPVPTLVPTKLSAAQQKSITDILNKGSSNLVNVEIVEGMIEMFENSGISSNSIDSVITFAKANPELISSFASSSNVTSNNIDYSKVYTSAKVLFNELEDDDLGRIIYSYFDIMAPANGGTISSYYGGVYSAEFATQLATVSAAKPEISAFYTNIATNFQTINPSSNNMRQTLFGKPDLFIYAGRITTHLARVLLNNLTLEEIMTYVDSTQYISNEGVPNPANITKVINKVGSLLGELTFTEASYGKIKDIAIEKVEQAIEFSKEDVAIVDNTLYDGIQSIINYVKTEVSAAEIKSVYTGLHTLLSNIKRTDIDFVLATALEIMSAEDITKVDLSPAVVKVSQILSRTAQEMKAEDVVNIQNFIKDILKLANEKVIGTFVSYALINLDIDLLGTNIFTFAGFDVDDLTAEQTALVNEYLGTVMETIFGEAKQASYTKYSFSADYYYFIDESINLFAYDKNGDPVEYTDLTNFSTSKEGTFAATFKIKNQVYTYNYNVLSEQTYNAPRYLRISEMAFDINETIGENTTVSAVLYKNGYSRQDYNTEFIDIKMSDLGLDLTTSGVKYGFYKYGSMYQYFEYCVWPEDTSNLKIYDGTYPFALLVGDTSSVSFSFDRGLQGNINSYYYDTVSIEIGKYVDRTTVGEKGVKFVDETSKQTINLRYTVYTPEAIGNNSTISYTEGDYTVYTFTCSSTGQYDINITNVFNSGYIYLYGEGYHVSQGISVWGNQYRSLRLEEGTTYYFLITNYDEIFGFDLSINQNS